MLAMMFFDEVLWLGRGFLMMFLDGSFNSVRVRIVFDFSLRLNSPSWSCGIFAIVVQFVKETGLSELKGQGVILKDMLTLFKPGGHIMPTKLKISPTVRSNGFYADISINAKCNNINHVISVKFW